MVVTDKQADIAILRTLGNAAQHHGHLHCKALPLAGRHPLGLAGGVALATHVDVVVPFIERLFGVKFLAPDVYLISDLPSQVQWAMSRPSVWWRSDWRRWRRCIPLGARRGPSQRRRCVMNEAKTMEAANDGTVVLECRQLAKAFRQGSERLEVLRKSIFRFGAANGWPSSEVPDRVRARCCTCWVVWIRQPQVRCGWRAGN